MASLGTLVVNLGANTAALAAGLNRGKGLVSGFAATVKNSVMSVNGLLAGIGAGVSVGAALYGIQSRIASLAGVADKAAQTGLSGAFLQKLQFAADQSGVSMETLEKSIGKMTVLVGQSSPTFAKLGLNIGALRAMSPEQQFASVVDAISKLPTAADRAAAAVSVFGKSGLEMTTLLSGGVNDLNALLAEAGRLGIGLTDDALKQAAAADDALQKMWSVLSALTDKVVVALAPGVIAVANGLSEWVAPLNRALNAFLAMQDKAGFLSDVLQSAFKVATLSIELMWKQMLEGILKSTIAAAMKVQLAIANGGKTGTKAQQRLENMLINKQSEAAARGITDAAGFGIGGLEKRLGKEKGIFGGLMGQLQGPPPAVEQVAPGNVQQSLQDWMMSAGESVFGALSKGGGAMSGVGSALSSTWLGGFQTLWDSKPQTGSTRGPGVALRGSQDAFSTIMANVNGGKKPPEVAAIEKQTKDLIKGLKPQPTMIQLVESLQ